MPGRRFGLTRRFFSTYLKAALRGAAGSVGKAEPTRTAFLQIFNLCAARLRIASCCMEVFYVPFPSPSSQ